jgi:hypothetical protein
MNYTLIESIVPTVSKALEKVASPLAKIPKKM